MPGLVVVGAQWGDEGKGKLVDYLTSNADWVVRFQGGNNAGHTLVVGGIKTKLSLVPSGILRAHSRCAIGAGVVLNPDVLADELSTLAKAGVKVDPHRLIIDRDAHLILPYHAAIDQARELKKGKDKIGTTGRGIGPAYEDRAGRSGVRLADLKDLPALKARLEIILDERNQYLSAVLGASEPLLMAETWAVIERAHKQLLPFVGNVSLVLDEALKKGVRVVFEGAQGTMLDQTFGTIPFVTSSHTLAGAVTTGCGIGARYLDCVLGVAKAYCTRVGEGPFPTELADATGDLIRKTGAEFGTITGRPRRCGWFDAAALKRAVRLNGIDCLAITKLDILSGIDKLKVCVKYILDGQELDDAPALAQEWSRVQAKYIELDGWAESLDGVRKWHELPGTARLYLNALSEIVGCPITIVSVGPDREQTLFSSGASFVKNFINLDEI